MKCDELQERWFEAYPVEGDQIIPTKVYGKKDTDDAIAELQAENAQLKKEIEFTHSNCQWNAGDGCARLLGEKLAIINENVELKAKSDKLHSCLKCLVMRDLIKDCSEKESVKELLEILK